MEGQEGIAVLETGQLAETKGVLAHALKEANFPSAGFKENQGLKDSWITRALEQLEQPTPEGHDTFSVICSADANLAENPHRGFVAEYFANLGARIKPEELNDYYLNPAMLRGVKQNELDQLQEGDLVWLTDENGKKIKIAAGTKIDGVQVLLNTDKVGNGTGTLAFSFNIT